MNPGLSGAVIGSLPSDCAKANTVRYVSSLVVRPRMTSTSFISGTGLKKCSPANRSGRLVFAASSVMHSDEVFEQRMVVLGDDRFECREGPCLLVDVLDDRLDDQVRSP